MKKKCKNSFAGQATTDQILARLRAGGWASGEGLAMDFSISRAAVGKHIDKLRRCGHIIRSRTRKGYFLEVPAEHARRGLVEPLLATRLLGRTEWRELATTPSTNSEAIAWALAGGPEGGVVTADVQTRGKGRRGHNWFSSPRGVHFSVIMPCRGVVGADYAKTTEVLLQAVREAIANVAALAATIKKPNDLYLNGRKICGVLIESGQRGGEADWMVAGVGCNVNVLREEFPEDIRDRVTSLYLEGGEIVSPNRLLAEILNRLEYRARFARAF